MPSFSASFDCVSPLAARNAAMRKPNFGAGLVGRRPLGIAPKYRLCVIGACIMCYKLHKDCADENHKIVLEWRKGVEKWPVLATTSSTTSNAESTLRRSCARKASN